MRLAYTSDVHSDATPLNAALVPHLASRVAALGPDAFVLAGDIAETQASIRATLDAFDAISVPKFYLPGNHDLFIEGAPEKAAASGTTSRDRYLRLLPAVAAAAGFQYIGLAAHRIGDIGIVGVTGWYDYAFRDPALAVAVAPAHYHDGTWRDIRAFDRGHVFWPAASGAPHAWASDLEIDAWMCRTLAAQTAALGDTAHTLAVVHVLPFAALVQRGAFGPVSYHDAWLGSGKLGETLRKIPRLRAVLCGHQHRSADLVVDGIRTVASPVGTLRDPAIDLAQMARERIGVIDIG